MVLEPGRVKAGTSSQRVDDFGPKPVKWFIHKADCRQGLVELVDQDGVADEAGEQRAGLQPIDPHGTLAQPARPVLAQPLAGLGRAEAAPDSAAPTGRRNRRAGLEQPGLARLE